jgi:hypothetical protein
MRTPDYQANTGRYADHQNNNKPICKDCVVAGDTHDHFSDETCEDTLQEHVPGREIEVYMLLPVEEQGDCWSCLQMIEEAEDAQEEEEEEDTEEEADEEAE